MQSVDTSQWRVIGGCPIGRCCSTKGRTSSNDLLLGILLLLLAIFLKSSAYGVIAWKRRSTFTVSGFGKFVIAAAFSGIGEMPSAVTICPRNFTWNTFGGIQYHTVFFKTLEHLFNMV
ncbi:hypothetical protein NPIL_540351 [Nephila pilipes]|uniref:Uncharacterized protein n=1 Tax=Nephila pilipes TaxID=299642 RepID=A0A8X6PR69_NEPPI|nr:hypothetical protein NPIL_540351 [Nephila pilipes]